MGIAQTTKSASKTRGRGESCQAQSSNSYDPYFLPDQFKIMQNEIILYPVIRAPQPRRKLGRGAEATAALRKRSRFKF